MESVVKTIEQNGLVLRLERNQREVGQLKNKLNSYVCEPKTYSFYERIENLKNRLENLSSANNEILRTLKERRKSVEDYVESVRKQLNEFHELQQGVADYVRGVRSC
jgi:chromosome segregation ATPase